MNRLKILNKDGGELLKSVVSELSSLVIKKLMGTENVNDTKLEKIIKNEIKCIQTNPQIIIQLK